MEETVKKNRRWTRRNCARDARRAIPLPQTPLPLADFILPSFVCRRHDDHKIGLENIRVTKGTKRSFTALFRSLRYYELGPDDPPYAAKFYDCCGSEEPEAAGCTTSFHVSYDDD